MRSSIVASSAHPAVLAACRVSPPHSTRRIAQRTTSVSSRGFFALACRASEDDDPLPVEDRTPTPQRRSNPNIEGGKYGMGTRIDSALDASSNPNTFLAGALLATIGAVVLFIFGPSPPTEY